MKKLMMVVVLLFVVISISGCRKDKEENVPIDLSNVVKVEETTSGGILWDWSEVDFDDFNWFQNIFKKDTKFTVDIFVNGNNHIIEFRNSDGELIGYSNHTTNKNK